MMGTATESEIDGRRLEQLMIPEHRDRVRTRVAERRPAETDSVERCELLRADGTTTPVEVLGQSLVLGETSVQLIVIRDISEWKAAEAQLRDSEERYRVLYEDNLTMYFTVDSGGQVLSVNRFGAEQLGYEPDQLTGRNVLHVFHDDDKESVKAQLAECLANPEEIATWEFRKVRKDGSVLWVHERARTIRSPDGNQIVLIVCEDVTEKKAAEEEQARLHERVLLAQKLESLGLMASGVAHDFNNLLVGILTNASLARSNLSSESGAFARIRAVEKAAERAAELCKQLLAYTGRGRREMRRLCLASLMRDSADLFEVALPRKGLLRYDLAPDVPAIEADAVQLEQVAMNLVTNASEAIGDHDGEITIRTFGLRLDEPIENPPYEKVPAGCYAALEIVDDGSGMEEEVVLRMFDPFFTTKFTGRGLGLAAVQGIVLGHRGALQVRSQPGRGTTIRVLFPALDGDAELETPKATAELPRWQAGSGTILVVDDEPVVLEATQVVLELAGFRVRTASDGVEAIEIFKKYNADTTLVLLDMTMPRLSGEETLRALREIRGDVQVLLSTGYAEEEVSRRFGKDAPQCIRKPYRPETLLEAVRKVLEC
jgi:PAS domain S-box-containing protein